jgi:hypothetical protein
MFVVLEENDNTGTKILGVVSSIEKGIEVIKQDLHTWSVHPEDIDNSLVERDDISSDDDKYYLVKMCKDEEYYDEFTSYQIMTPKTVDIDFNDIDVDG